MNRVKIIIAVLLACAGIVTGRAQTNNVGTNTVITIQQGTNIVSTVLQGTNSQITVKQGTNQVVTVTVGTKNVAKPATNQWATTVAAGLTLTRGNSDVLLFTSKVASVKKNAKDEYSLEADASYGENNGVDNAETLHGSAQYNHLFSEKFYGFANVEGLHDGIQDIRYRLSINPGAGYYFIKSKATSLVGEIGPGIVTEQLNDVQTTYASMRVAEHLDQALSPTSKMWEKAELISQVNEPDNYYVNAEIGMETAITKKLSLQVTLDDDYVNDPAAGRVPNDIKLVSGIAYKF
jgi:putative salt-induced outer membrane protein YdiY